MKSGVRGLFGLGTGLIVVLAAAHGAGAAARDDTAAIQAKLDAGGQVFLPKLPDGRCYRTRGLWLSRDDTTVTSDGACIVALGRGEARIKTGTGRPVYATSVFFLTHSNVRVPPPVRVTISGLQIRVPAAAKMNGVAVHGHATTLSNVRIDGTPLTNVVIGGGRAAAAGLSLRNAVLDSVLSGGTRDVITAYGAVGLRVERNTLQGSRKGAGLHIRSADRGQPTLDVRVTENTVTRNAGGGVFFDLAPANGAPVLASRIDVAGNRISGNARAGIVLAGGQSDGRGTLALRDNVITANRGPAVLQRRLRLLLSYERNELRSNRGGVTGSRAGAVVPAAPGAPTVPPAVATSPRDDTRWLQARLDRDGGTIFLPKLPDGECYATRGLWVSHDDTTITSDGACIVSLGLGAVRLRSYDGDPIAASGVFFINRSGPTKPAPVRITISNLRIVVPEGQGLFGVVVYGHLVELRGLEITGSPKDDITIGGRANGNDYATGISILNSRLSGANRNALSAAGVIGLRIEGNTIEGVRDSPPGQPAAGIDIEPDSRSAPMLDLRIAANTVRGNAGPGIMLELEPNDGPAIVATALEIIGNTIVGNALKLSPPKRAGLVLAGGQDRENGTLALHNNVIRGNGGPGIFGSRLRLNVQASGNDLSSNEGGPSRGF